MRAFITLGKLAIATVLIGTFSGRAVAQEACSTYVVKAGDSLGSISEKAYGTFDYQMIFNANRNTLGENPNTLELGITLNLPCKDGRLTEDAAFNSIVEKQNRMTSENTGPSVYAPDIKMLAGNDWKPYTDETLGGGGALMRIATTALQRSGNDRGYAIGWIDDFDSHLYTLLPSGAYDIAVAWVVPDCSTKPELMGENSLYRCNAFFATVPVYESVIGYYTRADSEYANATRIEDYAGARFCRMEGFFTNDLEEAGLVDPVIELVRPKTTTECIKAVITGEADATGMAIQQASGAIAGLDAQKQVIQNPNFTHLSEIRFLAHKSNPFGLQYIAMLNNGLNEMRRTGEWYDIISGSLAEYNAQNQ